MSAPVLVTYATRYGSTGEVAEQVAAGLRHHGFVVDSLPIREVDRLDDYGGVVIGAPIYIGQWHKEARTFLARYERELAGRPVAIFALGPLSDEASEVQGARAQLESTVAGYPWLKPVAVELFGGKYDPGKLGFLHKLLAVLPASPLHGRPLQDARDWPTIRAWSSDVAGLMYVEVPAETIA
jgi:menaquinone-dependent protoporphyrinogen oxidase